MVPLLLLLLLQVLRGAFTYDWRLWTLPDLVEALGEAGYSRVGVWVKPLRVRGAQGGAVVGVWWVGGGVCVWGGASGWVGRVGGGSEVGR
jgi:hypothetical protein